MNFIEISIAFVAAIISVGTPLVFQVISKFDEQYHSESILDLFEKKSNKTFFQAHLIFTLIVILVYISLSIVFIHLPLDYEYILLKYGSYILLITSIILVFSFIHFTYTAIKFSRPTSLLNLLIDENKENQYQDSDILESIYEFTIYNISKKNLKIFHEQIINHFINVIDYFEKDNIAYIPEKIYDIAYKITRELVSNKNPDFDHFKYLTIQNLWILSSDKRTYDWLWRNLVVVVINKEDEMIYKYWKKAFQHFEYQLRLPDTIRDEDFNIENQDEFDSINQKREQFLTFHYYLGGLLLKENRLECIRRIWNHTNSEPPRYPLLPSTMAEIFNRYFNLCTIYEKELWENAVRFNLPGNDSINFDWVVNAWQKRYMILLFLRQYTLTRYYSYEDFLALPKSPETQAEKKHWLDNLSWFKEYLKEVIKNTEMLQTLKFDHIENDCQANKISTPLELVDQFIEQLEKDFKKDEEGQPVSKEKEQKFLESTKNILETAIKEYDKIFNHPKIKEKKYDSFFYGGRKIIAKKSDFADNQPYDHINFDSFLAEEVSQNLLMGISTSFLSVVKKSYLIKGEEIFHAIDRLKISDHPNDYVIVSFRNNIKYFTNVLEVPGLSENSYKGIHLINIWNCDGRVVRNMFFVLKKTDCPVFEYLEPKDKMKKDYNAEEQILKTEPVYASITDLSRNPEIVQKLQNEGITESLDDKVLVAIEMLAKISWKKDAKVVAISLANAYDDKGIPNKLGDINPFDEL